MVTKVTDVVAGFAVLTWVNPTLVQWLNDISELLGPLTTIVAFVWLVIRIGDWGLRRWRRRSASEAKHHD